MFILTVKDHTLHLFGLSAKNVYRKVYRNASGTVRLCFELNANVKQAWYLYQRC